MKYLRKVKSKIILIDVFSEDERKSADNQITQKLHSFLDGHDFKVQPFYPDSEKDIFKILKDISEEENGDGLIIHLIGHRVDSQIAFGNKNFSIKWIDIKSLLVDINTKTNNGLIVNTTIMCYGKNIFQLIDGKSKPFYAAIGSSTSQSLQAWLHNKQLYEKCFYRDVAEYWLATINNNLPDLPNGQKHYELCLA